MFLMWFGRDDEEIGKQNMNDQTELAPLENYAKAASCKVYTSQSDLNPKDKPMVQMQAWCSKQGDIVVLNSGVILTCDPASRSVQNCKIIMANKGIVARKVIPATRTLIAMLLANAEVDSVGGSHKKSVSEQQQRLRMLVHEARQADVSDIHLEVRQDVTRIRFRKHGELYLHAEWIAKLGKELASVAFNKETDHTISHFNPLVPQSGSMSLIINGQDVRLRLASMPTHGGFDVVMRVLATGDDALPGLTDLGYTEKQIQLLHKAIAMPHGAVLISGPTGSGKTTTVASCLQLIPSYRKVYTIEEPIEKVIYQTSQVPVNTEHDDRGFATMGRAALRMDPDVIVLGEMRDEETAHVMVRAALTGHLVFSTLHTNSATAIVTRLIDMGISPRLLGDSNLLVCLICQRLVPLLCQSCAIPLMNSEIHKPYLKRWQSIFDKSLMQLKVRGHHCEHCKGTGLNGRTLTAEIIWVDRQGRQCIQQADTLAWEKYLRQQGWKNHAEHAIELIQKGLCDPLDVERVVGELHPQQTNIY